MSSVQNELAAHYRLARIEHPDHDPDEIVALVAERMGIDGEASLAAESLALGCDVDVIRQFVYAVERPDGDA
jgi:hypothetical protein